MKEKPNLTYLVEQFKKMLYRVNATSLKVERKKGDLIAEQFARMELKQATDASEYYAGLIKDFGSEGELSVIRGKCWAMKENGVTEELRDFEMYLACSTQDAQTIFETQVAKTLSFKPGTISFTTIPLKHLILT
jgi:hypothetical protein